MQIVADGLSNSLYLDELITPEKTFINKLTVAHLEVIHLRWVTFLIVI